MSVLQLLRSAATATVPTGKLQLLRSAAALTVHQDTHLQLLRSAAALAVVPVVVAPASRQIGPGEAVTLTAALADGTAADSWSWVRLSGPPVLLVGTGATRTVTGPSIWGASPQIVQLGITATVGSRTSAQAIVSLTVLPQTVWLLDTDGTLHGAVVAPA